MKHASNVSRHSVGAKSKAPSGQNPTRPVAQTATGTAKTLYVTLAPEAEVAVLCRMLHYEGYNDHNWGHITYVQDDETILLTPWEIPWDEIHASDILRIDREGKLLEGQWSVTPAVALHLEVHRARDDVSVVVHHHPEWASVWAAVGEVPPPYNQGASGIKGEIAFFDEYEADVTFQDVAEQNVAAMGDSVAGLLANHGVLVFGDSIRRAHERCAALEMRCRLAWRVQALGEHRGRPMSPAGVEHVVAAKEGDKFGDRYYHAMVRREILRDPAVLT